MTKVIVICLVILAFVIGFFVNDFSIEVVKKRFYRDGYYTGYKEGYDAATCDGYNPRVNPEEYMKLMYGRRKEG